MSSQFYASISHGISIKNRFCYNAIIYVLLCKMLWFVKGKTNLWIRLPLTLVLHHIVFVLFHKTNLDPFHVNPTVHVLLQKRNFFTPISPALFLFPIIITKHITGWDWSDPVWPPPRQQGEQQQQQQPHHPPQRPPRQHQRQELVGSVSLYFIFSWDCLFILYILAGLSLYALYSRRAVPLYFIF